MSSYPYGKADINFYIRTILPKDSTCLDVGACDGEYHRLLGDWLTMDAVEVWEPNIELWRLDRQYRMVYHDDIRGLKYGDYDLVIFGDIIEHLTVEEAQEVLAYAKEHAQVILVAVPYQFEQGAIYGNPYERHLQPDLTHEIFCQRYEGFKLVVHFHNYGYYVWSKLV